MKRIVFCLSACLIAACGSPDPSGEEDVLAAQYMETQLSAELPPPVELKNAPPTPEETVRISRQFMFTQVELYLGGLDTNSDRPIAQILSLLGREDLIDHKNTAPPRCPRRWVDPVDSIRASVKGHQVVVLEENGHRSRQRAFITDVSDTLLDDGFSYYASDAFNLNNPPLNLSEFAKLDEGLLVREPLFGRLLRNLKTRDVHFTSLDMAPLSRPTDPEARTPENMLRLKRIAQADQLAFRVFNADPNARVIVHLVTPASQMPDIIDTQKTSDALNAFADRLIETTGVTPLFIGQSRCEAGWTGSVMLPELGRGGAFADRFSIVVAHPEDRLNAGRPVWRRERGDTDVSVPPIFKSNDLPVIIEARRKGEPDIAVPSDRLLLLPGDDLPLLLPTGTYRIEGWTKNGPVAEPVLLDVG